MNGGVQVFLYPEELDHTAPDELAQVLELGCDAVSVSVAYHRARRVFPRHGRVSVLTRSTLYIEPDRSRYGSLVPDGARWEALLRFREACDRAGVRFRAWVVGLHNGELAAGTPKRRRACWTARPLGTASAPRLPRPWSTWPRSPATSPRSSAQRRSTSRPASTRLGARVHPHPVARAALRARPAARRPVLLRVLSRAPRRRRGGAGTCGRRAAVRRRSDRRRPGGALPMRATGAARLLAAVAASVHEGGSSSACSSPARPSRRRCRGSRRSRSPPPTRSSSAAGRSAGEQLRPASPACARSPAAPDGLHELDARAHGAGSRCRAARGSRSRGSRALQPLARPSCRTRGVPRRACLSWRGRALMVIDGHVMLGEGRRGALPRAAARDDGPARDRPRARLPGRGPSTRAKP